MMPFWLITFSVSKVDQMSDTLHWPLSFELSLVVVGGDRASAAVLFQLLFTGDRTEEQSYYQKKDKRKKKTDINKK